MVRPFYKFDLAITWEVFEFLFWEFWMRIFIICKGLKENITLDKKCFYYLHWMLTFLRKIRKSLIESGSTRKYLIYAIGEILLVMIGILLALQVNSWNSHRTDRILEVQYLNNMLVDLSYDELHHSQSKKVWNNHSKTAKILIKTLASDSSLIFKSKTVNHFLN